MSLRPKKVDFEEKWGFLKDCFQKTLTMTGTEGVHGADVRLAVYQLCECPDPHPYSEELYYAIKAMVEDHVRDVGRELCWGEQRSEPLLQKYLHAWDMFVVGTAAIESLVHFLDSSWVTDAVLGSPNPMLVEGLSPLLLEELGEDLFGPNESDRQDVFFFSQLCINSWSQLLFTGVAGRLADEVLRCIRSDRKGEGSLHTLVTQYRDSLLGLTQAKTPLQMYQTWMEGPYIEDMAAFYRVEASNFIMENGILNYLYKCQSRVEDEELRLSKYLDSSSIPSARTALNDVLIAQNAAKIYAELRTMLELEQLEHISRAHSLLSRVPEGLLPLQKEWRRFAIDYSVKRLQALLATTLASPSQSGKKGEGRAKGVDPSLYVETLIAVYSQLVELVRTALAGSVDFRCILDKVLMEIMKDNCVMQHEKATPHYSAHQLATYLDSLLRGSKAKCMDEREQETQVELCISLFKLVEDKDVFRKYYSSKLAFRLIDNVSASDYLEQLVLTSLHNVCGFDYVAKLRKMVQDIKLAAGCNERFRAHLEQRLAVEESDEVAPGEEIEPAHRALLQNLSVLVLTTASWPLAEPRTNFQLPPVLAVCVDLFTRFYNTEHSGRKLMWLHNHSKGDLELVGFKKAYMITMPTYFMAVLLLFNEHSQLSYAALKSKTNLSDVELQFCLLKLSKCRLLLSVGKDGAPQTPRDTTKLTTSSRFEVNQAFAYKSVRFKISGKGPQSSTTQAVDSRIDHDRHLYLQAAIVRVMKHRKQLTHEALIVEVLSQATLGFKPAIPAIKRCVEQLIDKEYLERLPESSSTYRYLA